MSRRLTAAALAALLAVGVVPASAQSGEDPRERRDEVREERAANAAELDALRATDAELEEALSALRRDVAAQQGAVEDAQRAVRRAERDVVEAQAAVEAAQAQIAGLEARQQAVAVDSYIREGSNSGDIEVLNDGDPLQVAERQALLDLTSGRNADIADQLTAAREDLRDERARAEEAEARAEEQRGRAQRRLADLEAAQERQAAFAAEVDQRIEARLAEAANLEQLDADLSAQIAAQQAALARQNPGGGSLSPVPVTGGPGSLSTVGGITVASSIAGQLSSLLSASRSAGLSLGGGGYRDPAAQWALRNAHCPDPANSPPSACSPPTARPGTSLHEQGLAIDFTNNGRLITSRSDPAFVWLSANAGSYGFYNLPSEPWHWSTTGG
ncbi:MAG: D-alanyl-D-alanine carboxypeptidase family protein [Acidimicrobiales bacterium]|nr:D-alanyl-D-alanine carboxypeptidase family protein [Acidimicrobiales bacterium]MCB9372451.1 D-alanyl-D-alanine carboxypeptidase family protein [Microthrixaceae bacterium]